MKYFNSHNLFNKTKTIVLCFCAMCLIVLVFYTYAYAGTLVCSVASSCPSGVTIFKLSDTSNAHAELASQSNYTQLVCCSGVTGLSNVCSGTYDVVAKLSSTTNAHIEQNNQSNYANNVCITAPSGGSVVVGYQSSNCSGFDTTVASLSGVTNAHGGNSLAYTTKICATASGITQSLSFSLSTTTVGFGTLVSSQARYATNDLSGSANDTAHAHTISASTNATNGYAITLNGSSLAYNSDVIDPIGATAVASNPGTEQFGVRVLVDSGTGVAQSPYNTANWAFDTASFPDTIATGDGDDVTTVFGVRYIGNISAATPPGSYTTALTYTITAGF